MTAKKEQEKYPPFLEFWEFQPHGVFFSAFLVVLTRLALPEAR